MKRKCKCGRPAVYWCIDCRKAFCCKCVDIEGFAWTNSTAICSFCHEEVIRIEQDEEDRMYVDYKKKWEEIE